MATARLSPSSIFQWRTPRVRPSYTSEPRPLFFACHQLASGLRTYTQARVWALGPEWGIHRGPSCVQMLRLITGAGWALERLCWRDMLTAKDDSGTLRCALHPSDRHMLDTWSLLGAGEIKVNKACFLPSETFQWMGKVYKNEVSLGDVVSGKKELTAYSIF